MGASLSEEENMINPLEQVPWPYKQDDPPLAVLQYSQAVSLKRIADALETIAQNPAPHIHVPPGSRLNMVGNCVRVEPVTQPEFINAVMTASGGDLDRYGAGCGVFRRSRFEGLDIPESDDVYRRHILARIT
jgi:hypothetical protein